MKKNTLCTLQKMKQKGEKIAVLTAYDASFARLLSQSGVDVLLVGDSLGMVITGVGETIPVTLAETLHHTRAVARGNQGAFLVADMPFMTYATIPQALKNAAAIVQAGAGMVKLEGASPRLLRVVTALTECGIPVCGHLGLVAQSVHALGGYKIQGRNDEQAAELLRQAKSLEQAGARMLVIECIPYSLARDITQSVSIPVIGIGAGPDCDGQVLVCYDMLGLSGEVALTFVKNFLQGQTRGVAGAIEDYVKAVKSQEFPKLEHSFE